MENVLFLKIENANCCSIITNFGKSFQDNNFILYDNL